MVDGKVESKLKKLIAFLVEQGFIITLLRQAFIQHFGKLLAHADTGLAVFEPILDQEFG